MVALPLEPVTPTYLKCKLLLAEETLVGSHCLPRILSDVYIGTPKIKDTVTWWWCC